MKWVLGIFLFICAVIVSFITSPVYADMHSNSWMTNGINIVSRVNVTPHSGSNYPCNGDVLMISINGDEAVEDACVYGSGDKYRFAMYTRDGSYRYAISFPGQDGFYDLRGACTIPRCVYSAETDVFISHKNLPYWRYTASIYKGFSEHLVRYFDAAKMTYYYQFETDEPPAYTPKMGDIEASVVSVALSKNGKWALFELPSYGIVRVNTETLHAKRVMAPGSQYGMFSDPTYEMAITNSGKSIVFAGNRVGLTFIEVNDTCGDYLVAETQSNYSPNITSCPRLYPVVVQNAHVSFYAQPRFINDDMLGLNVIYGNGSTDRLILSNAMNAGVLDYLALGDSYSSGEGELEDRFYRNDSNLANLKCHVGIRSYPFLVAESRSVTGQNIACSGARTVDVVGYQDYLGQENTLVDLNTTQRIEAVDTAMDNFQAGIVPQVDFLARHQPKLVTIGIGGNDAGLIGKLTGCLSIGTCEWANDISKKYASSKEISVVYSKLRETIRKARSVSPKSKMVVIGYPKIINEHDGAKCDVVTGSLLDSIERRFINESIQYLNQVVRAAANAERVLFVDIENAFSGYELCGEINSSAMNGVRLGDDIAPIDWLENFYVFGSESFHPTPFGHELIARNILSGIPSDISQADCGDCGEGELPPPSSYWTPPIDGEYIKQVQSTTLVEGVLKLGESFKVWGKELFEPLSDIRIELHSDTREIGIATADKHGSLLFDALPLSDIRPGYHTIHLFGTSITGELIDVYQVVAIERKQVNVVVPTTDLPTLPSDTVDGMLPQRSTQLAGSLFDSGLMVNQSSILGLADNAKLPIKKESAIKPINTGAVASLWILIIAGFVIGCMATYIIVGIVGRLYR